jgi:hypothetical protein
VAYGIEKIVAQVVPGLMFIIKSYADGKTKKITKCIHFPEFQYICRNGWLLKSGIAKEKLKIAV